MKDFDDRPLSPMQVIKRIAALEVCIVNLNISIQTFNTVISPSGWIGEAFELMESDMAHQFDAVNTRIDAVEAKLNSVDNKLDVICST